MKHESLIWQVDDDGAGIIKRKGLNYPDEDPRVILRLSEHDLLTGQDSYFPTSFFNLADGLTPPLYGITELAYIQGEDCLPTTLQTPLFNLKALEVLESAAPNTFTTYPVLVLQYRTGTPYDTVRAFLADSEVRLAADGYALIKPTQMLDNTSAQVSRTDQGILLESEQEIPLLFQSGDSLYFCDRLKRAVEEAGIRGLKFNASLSFSDFA